MAIFFFIQYSILRKKEYLFYAVYLLLLTVYYFVAIPEYFFNIDPAKQDVIARFDLFKRPVQFLISVFYSLFVMYYLGLQKRSQPLYRIFIVLIVLYLLLSAACLLGNLLSIQYDPAYYLISLLLFPLQMIVVIALFKYKVAYGRFIIWGTILVLVGSCITLVISLSLADPDTIFTNASAYIPVMISILLDIFLFTIALQRKIADNEKSLVDAAYSRQQAVMLERERIIADLHDDVGGGLSSIRMISDLMAHQTQGVLSPEQINFVHKISDTAKEIAARMNTIIWSLNSENDTLQNFTEYTRHFGVSFFEASSIRFQFHITGNLPLTTVLGGVLRKNLFLIIKEALHNTLKHSEASLATLELHMKNGLLCIEITDNGSGIKNENSFGNGLKNMQKRIEEIGGTLKLDAESGTKICVEVAL